MVSFLRRLLGGNKDPLLGQAENLVQAAKINAVSSFTTHLDRFPILRQVDPEHWDFLITVAGVFMAATRLANLRLEDTREDKLMDVVIKLLNEWMPISLRAFENCKGLFEQEFNRLDAAGHEPRFTASDAVGIWIAWNLLDRAPKTEEDLQLVRTTGIVATAPFFDWWDK